MADQDNSNQRNITRGMDVSVLFPSRDKILSMVQFGTKLFLMLGQCFCEIKSRPASRTALYEMLQLVGEERAAQGLVATAAAAVFPFHLDHPVKAAKGLVETRAVGGSLGGTELEVALVGIFVAG